MDKITWGQTLQTFRQVNFISVGNVLYLKFNKTLLKIFLPKTEEYQGEKYSWTRNLDPHFSCRQQIDPKTLHLSTQL
jgi:hypothetical protein